MSKTGDAAPETGNPSGDAAPADVVLEKVDTTTPIESSDGTMAPETLPAIELAPLTLKVAVPSTEIREGANQIQAVATLSRPSDSGINWTIEGAKGVDLGSIDSSGKYTSPTTVTGPLAVTIVATLASDPTIKDSKAVNVIPNEVLFVGCKKGNAVFPIAADVFTLPPQTSALPDFSKLTKSDTVCLDKFDIPNQPWEIGFPGAPQLQEWFALRTASRLIAPKAGKYTFRINSDDGSRVKLNGTEIINNDGNHGDTTKYSAEIELKAGSQDLLLNWYQGPRTKIALQLWWKLPGAADYVIIPTEAFAAAK